MKKILILSIAMLMLYGFVAALEKLDETAPDYVNEEAEKNAYFVKQMADELEMEIRINDDNPGLSEGRRIHFLDYFKLLDRKDGKMADYESDDQDCLYLYSVMDNGEPRTMLILQEENDKAVHFYRSGGNARGYYMAVEKVRELAPGCPIKVYNLDFIGHFISAYALQFEVGGEEYLFPFDGGDDLDMDFYNLDDYHKLPKTEDFLAAVDEILAELEEQKKLQKPGEKYYGYPVVQLKTKD